MSCHILHTTLQGYIGRTETLAPCNFRHVCLFVVSIYGIFYPVQSARARRVHFSFFLSRPPSWLYPSSPSPMHERLLISILSATVLSTSSLLLSVCHLAPLTSLTAYMRRPPVRHAASLDTSPYTYLAIRSTHHTCQNFVLCGPGGGWSCLRSPPLLPRALSTPASLQLCRTYSRCDILPHGLSHIVEGIGSGRLLHFFVAL